MRFKFWAISGYLDETARWNQQRFANSGMLNDS